MIQDKYIDGTVTVHATQEVEGVKLLLLDTFGIRKHAVLPGAKLAEVPMQSLAEIHRRFSMSWTRRN